MIEPGRYRARCTGPADAQWGVSQNGNPQLALVFKFLDREGFEMTWIGTFAPGAATNIALQALENCGWQGIDPTEDLSGIESEEVELVVKSELDLEGNPRLRIAWVNRPGYGRIQFTQPAGPAELAAFKGDIRAAVAARRSGARPTRSQERTQRQSRPPNDDFGPMPADDDIPF